MKQRYLQLLLILFLCGCENKNTATENVESYLPIHAVKPQPEMSGMVSGLCMIPLLVSTALLLIVLRKQNSAIETKHTQQQHLASELRTKYDLESGLRDALEFKAKEMTSFTLSMIQKKEMLESIRFNIEDIKIKATGDVKNQLGKIVSTIDLSQNLDREWENFKVCFDQVHHGFFATLQDSFPELNANDLKLCSLLRMNVNTRQIASIMDISPDSVKVAKHRIRKKMGLTSADNLNNFFTSIVATKQLAEGESSDPIPDDSSDSTLVF